MKDVPREKLLIMVTVAAVGLLFLDRMMVTPLTTSWRARSAKIAQLDKDVAQGRALLERERSIRERWKEMQTRSLPHNRPQAETEILNRVDRWSRSARFTLNSIVPAWREKEEDHARLECRVEGSGDMGAVMKWIHELDGETLALRVESLEIVSRDKNGSQLGLDIRFSGLELPEDKQR